MEVKLSYGKNGLMVNLPDYTKITEPQFLPALPDQHGALKDAIRNPISTPPLRQSVVLGQKIGISVCDITRPIPTNVILSVLLAELGHIPEEDITIFIATGTHRSNNKSELDSMLGQTVTSRGYNIINHDAFDEANLSRVGTTKNGIPVFINSDWIKSDFKITIGFVEPHFFAGFSGGPKMVAPGLAGFETIMHLHNSDMIGHPNSTWAITEGNPIHDAIREIANIEPVDFSLDVTLNKNKGITSVYAGNMFKVHKACCDFSRSTSTVKVDHKFDIVITTNSGYPLDMNLYQAVKGMSAASSVVATGGSIICAAECSDGIPEHGNYGNILTSASSPDELLELINKPDYNRHDQWQVQIQAQIQSKATVYVKSDYLTQSQIANSHLHPIDNIEETILKLCLNKPGSSICVLPEGPQTIPYIK